MDQQEPIRNNPSFTKLRKEMEDMLAFGEYLQLLAPWGLEIDKIWASMEEQVSQLRHRLEEHTSVLEQFNDVFSEMGWIAYEGMKHDVMKSAVELANKQKLEEAEQLLVDYYDEIVIRQQLVRMCFFIKEFQPRERLLLKALEDYVAERYHACVPIVLANVDGLVSDILGPYFFKKDTNPKAFDSIAAHSTGLSRLNKVFSDPRKTTTTETITVPYRNGILHGRDLGYDNKIVAAKAWAALFAVRDWIIALRKPAPKQEPHSP